MTEDTRTPENLPDPEFMVNVRAARDNGADIVCAYCGIGVWDDGQDEHDKTCPLYEAP